MSDDRIENRKGTMDPLLLRAFASAHVDTILERGHDSKEAVSSHDVT
jgi:hypothetical protein